jgi:hypothetical protein
MKTIILSLFLAGCCGDVVEIESPYDMKSTDLAKAESDNACLDIGAVCTFHGECCSGACVYQVGNYARCANSADVQGGVPLGYYQRGCQWDRCTPPPSNVNVYATDPVR